jgi:hypothetical protein
VTCDKNETIAWWPCTPPSHPETFSENIRISTGSGKEIAGLLKKMVMMKNDDMIIVKSRTSEFPRGELRARMKSLGIHV